MKAKRRSERRPWYEDVSDDDGDVQPMGSLSTIVPVKTSSSSSSEEEGEEEDEGAEESPSVEVHDTESRL